ncbi:Hpt domain-containing protein [Aliikangiella sp. IMCC44653]
MQQLDETIVADLADLMGEDLNTLFEAYLEDNEIKIKQLVSVCKQNDYDLIRRTAHSIKGSSRNVGALKFAIICESIENAALMEELESCLSFLDKLHLEYQQLKAEINKKILNQ